MPICKHYTSFFFNPSVVIRAPYVFLKSFMVSSKLVCFLLDTLVIVEEAMIGCVEPKMLGVCKKTWAGFRRGCYWTTGGMVQRVSQGYPGHGTWKPGREGCLSGVVSLWAGWREQNQARMGRLSALSRDHTFLCFPKVFHIVEPHSGVDWEFGAFSFFKWRFPGGSVAKNPRSSTRDLGLIPGLERYEGGNGNPL